MTVSCRCRSYNQPELGGDIDEIIISIPDHMQGRLGRHEGAETICLDLCIAPDVLILWAADIPTLASCCGHNRYPREIIVRAEDHERALAALASRPSCRIGAWVEYELVWKDKQ